MKSSLKPSVLKYRSATSFLQDYYGYHKANKRHFSYEKFSRDINYPHRSNLRLMTLGKRPISFQLQKCLEENVFTSTKERLYFRELCEAQDSLDVNNFNEEKFKFLQEHTEINVSAEEGHLLKNIYLYILLGYEDFDSKEESMRKFLGVTEVELKQALTELSRQGLVEFDPAAGKWNAKYDHTIFADDHKSKKLAQFHQESFARAARAQALPKELRHFDSLILSLSPEDYQGFLKNLRVFMDEQFYRYNSKRIAGKKLYHIQIGSFPALAVK